MIDNNVLPEIVRQNYDEEILARLVSLQDQEKWKSMMSRLIVLADFELQNVYAMKKFLVFTRDQLRELDGIFKSYMVLRDKTFLSSKLIKELAYRHHYSSFQATMLFIAQHGEAPVELLYPLREWTEPVFPLNGNDVKEAGVKTGREVGRLLDMVEQWWIEYDFQPSRDACIAQLKAIISSTSG